VTVLGPLFFGLLTIIGRAKMAVGDGKFPVMYPVKGFKVGIACAGVKTPNRKDLVVMELAEGSSVAGVFTKNAFCAAPVYVAKASLLKGAPRYWVTNTGNANAGTGEQGMSDAVTICSELASLQRVDFTQVMPFSTGVIGELLPTEKIVSALPAAVVDLKEDNWADAALGIMTTDTRPKGSSCQLAINGQTVTITGISKGSGMIKPNMATMLGYIATDVSIDPALFQQLMVDTADVSFNRITVDGDTSTNDSFVAAATGLSGVSVSAGSVEYQIFSKAFKALASELAQAIVRDGEGATKLVSVVVSGGATTQESLEAAFTVAESPLVKTALFASDPNWGRILAAVGRSGIANLMVEDVTIHLGDVLLVERGGRAQSYTEEAGQIIMNQDEITIAIDLGRGDCEETVWTCDFSYDYVRINAEYRT
jgi:glutamate N-acetyltransferase/amino-acid N-acetyltransferase